MSQQEEKSCNAKEALGDADAAAYCGRLMRLAGDARSSARFLIRATLRRRPHVLDGTQFDPFSSNLGPST
jgi:hypothetical protein